MSTLGWGLALMLAGLPGSRIVLDGSFEDWLRVSPSLTDASDAADAAVDFTAIRIAHDDRFVYLQIDLARPVNLLSVEGTVRVLFDADGNPATGRAEYGLAGVDLRLDLSPYPNEGARVVTGAGEAAPDAVGLLLAPTYSSRRFELRLNRAARFRGPRLRCKLVFTDAANAVRDETNTIQYRLRPASRGAPAAGATDPLLRSAGAAFRVLSWNVAGTAMLNRPEPFRRILAALAPDLILFDEVSSRSSAATVSRLLGEGWRALFGATGGRQRGVIASRAPLAPVPAMLNIQYPRQQRDALVALAPDARLRERMAEDNAAGAPTVGAIAEAAGRRLLVAPIDLQCCGGRPGGPADRLRQLEVESIHRGVAEALRAEQPDGVLVAGDFNLVASRAPLDQMIAGLDPAGGDLAIAQPLHLDGLAAYTWSSPGSPFPPGRLDYLLYSRSSLRVVRSFVFRTSDLAPAWLRIHGLAVSDSEAASDHLPIAADFAWRASASGPATRVR